MIKHERNAIGIPIVTTPERANKDQIREAARPAEQYKGGMASGGALPAGMSLELQGVRGGTSDPLASIEYHDQSMARNFLQMFIQLGQTRTGSRALAETFVTWFNLAQETIASSLVDAFNNDVTKRYFAWNYGPRIPTPLVKFKRHDSEALAVAGLVSLIQAGAISVGPELYDYMVSRFALPADGWKEPVLQPGIETPSTLQVAPGPVTTTTPPSLEPQPATTSAPANPAK